ncbi:MAG: universal stress protein [Desulfobacterales bacterium]
MFKRFIVATDLSPASFAVVNCLGELKAFGGEECLLLQCLSFKDAASEALSYSTEKLEGMLNEQKKILEDQEFRVEARTVVGTPKHEIVRIAAGENYDLIVVGAQGQSLIEEKLIGGVAYGVISRTEKPVLVIPVEPSEEENTCRPVARSRFGLHVLFATDFSEMADNAFTFVEQMVSHGVGKVTLVHVLNKSRFEDSLEQLTDLSERAVERLKSLKQKLPAQDKSLIDTVVTYGVPYQEITGLAMERDAQLVVMGTQGRGFIGEFFLGSVSHNVVRHSVAPVLLIPVPR